MDNSEKPQGTSEMSGQNAWEPEQVWLWAFANILLRRRYLILALPLATGFFTGILSLQSPREYRASASFLPQDPMPVQGGLGQLASQFGIAVTRPGTGSSQFYADLLQSRGVLHDVLTTIYHVSASPRFEGDLIEYFEVRSDTRDHAILAAMDQLRSSMSVSTDRTTGVVSFDVSTTNPDLSTQVAGRFLELVNDYNLGRRQSQARAEREFVEQRLALARTALSTAEDSLAGFYRRNRRYSDSPELVAEEARLQRQVTLRQQLYLSLSQNFEAAKIEEVRNTPVITVVERPEGFVERQRRGTVRKTLVAVVVGGLFAVALALSEQYLSRARRERSADYQEFLTLRHQIGVDLRRAFLRRGPSRSYKA